MIGANPVGPGAGQFGFAGTFSSAANGGANQLIDVPAAFLQTLVEGSTVWVQSVRDSYVWYPLDTDAADQLLIVKPTVIGAGAGRFVRNLIPSPRWMTQLTWYVDPANGAANDENSGLTALLPLKSDDERQRRMKNGYWNSGVYHIYYISDVGSVAMTGIRAPSSTVFLHGSATSLQGKATLHGGTLSAFTAIAPATNVPPDITDAGIGSWAPYVGQRIRLTSGANAGAIAWIIKDLGANKARTSNWIMPPAMTVAGISAAGTDVTPSAATVNATYVVESLTNIASVTWALATEETYGTHTGGIGACLDSLHVGGPWAQSAYDTIAFYLCYQYFCPAMQGLALHVYQGCQVLAPGFGYAYYNAGFTGGYGGYIEGSVGYIIFAYNFISQGGPLAEISDGCTVDFSGCAVFDSTGDGIKIRKGGAAHFYSGQYLWGSGNTGSGLNVRAGSTATYNGTFTIVGANDFKLGGSTSVRAFDNATGLFTAARATTWANLAAAVGAGGFGGSAIDPVSGAKIVVASP